MALIYFLCFENFSSFCTFFDFEIIVCHYVLCCNDVKYYQNKSSFSNFEEILYTSSSLIVIDFYGVILKKAKDVTP